jgi:hypothetical protein
MKSNRMKQIVIKRINHRSNDNMKLKDLFSFTSQNEDSSQDSSLETDEPAEPEDCTILLEEVTLSRVQGHPEVSFEKKECVYRGPDGRKLKIMTQKNPQATGCGHNLKSPDDVGFISHISNLPVCRICEAEYYRLRDQTRHEECVCRHLVAPHEFSYIKGKGFVCAECKKKEKAITLKKVGKWLWNSALKPLISDNPNTEEGLPHEFIQLPPPGNHPPVQHDTRTRP